MKRFRGVSWMIGGAAGLGINTVAELLSKALVRHGYYVFSNIEYESLIRGGHSYFRVRYDNRPVNSHVDYVDVLLALDDVSLVGDGGEHTYGHMDEFLEGSVLIFDTESSRVDKKVFEELKEKGVYIYDVPMTRIVREAAEGGKVNLVVRNMVGFGVSTYVLGLDKKIVEDVILERFAKRPQIAEANRRLHELGYKYALEHFKDGVRFIVDPAKEKNGLLVATGNHMAAAGAVKAGLRVWVQYPMTPASRIYRYLEEVKDKYGIFLVQPESELAVVNIAIGAAYGGARSGVATSGGGFALMSEAIGLAGIGEIPLVVVEVSRPGPSTGLPTRQEQGDLRQVLHAGQGYYPKAVILPGDPYEVFFDTANAFNIAWKYQMPVIVHYDKHIGESLYSFPEPDQSIIPLEDAKWLSEEEAKAIRESGGNYKRYMVTEDGVSPWLRLGTEGLVLWTTGNEHDEYGNTTEDIEKRVAQMDKRYRKVETFMKELEEKFDYYKPIQVFGDPDGDIAIVGWGSTKGVILDLLEVMNNDGYNVRFIQVRYAYPFPSEAFKKAIEGSKVKIIVENNFDGLMEGLIRENTLIPMDYSIRKYDGRPFSLGYLYDKISSILKEVKIVG